MSSPFLSFHFIIINVFTDENLAASLTAEECLQRSPLTGKGLSVINKHLKVDKGSDERCENETRP